MDSVLGKFLKHINVSVFDALLHFHLAPLSTRRDIAMLAVIHRTLLGLGPRHFRSFFILSSGPLPYFSRHRHSRHLIDPFDTDVFLLIIFLALFSVLLAFTISFLILS